MSSIEPDDSGGEVDGGEEISGGLVIAGGDSSELLEFAEEVFDQVARFVELAIEVAGATRFGRGGMTADLPAAAKGSSTRVGIEGPVGDQPIGRHLRQQRVGSDQIVGLSRRSAEMPTGCRVRRPGHGFSVLSPPRLRPIAWSSPFLGAPALCW